MVYSKNINLELFNIESGDDWWDLSSLFDDDTLETFIKDNLLCKYIYFIKQNEERIGFVYIMQFINSDIHNVEYGIKKKFLCPDTVYTVLTILRDKVKGIAESNEIYNKPIISAIVKDEKTYNQVANTFGNLIHSDENYNYYEINPNCENLDSEKEKIYQYLKVKITA